MQPFIQGTLSTNQTPSAPPVNPYSVYDKQLEDITEKVNEGMSALFNKFRNKG